MAEKHIRNGWVAHGEALARREIVYENSPSTDILAFWPRSKIREWICERNDSGVANGLQLPQQQNGIQEVGSSVVQPDRRKQRLSDNEYVVHVSTCLPFKQWVLKVQSSPKSLVDKLRAQMKQDTGEHERLDETLDCIFQLLQDSIAEAFINIESLRMLCMRLRVLEFRFKLIKRCIVEQSQDWKEMLFANFDFLGQVMLFEHASLAEMLSEPLRHCTRRVCLEDFVANTDLAQELTRIFNSHVIKVRECKAAGLKENISAVSKALFKIGNHHLGLALEVDVDMNAALRDYGNQSDQIMSSGACFPYFGECRKRVINLMNDHREESAIDLALNVIGKIWHFNHPRFAESSRSSFSLSRNPSPPLPPPPPPSPPPSPPESQASGLRVKRSLTKFLKHR